jgi:hypothetical protein
MNDQKFEARARAHGLTPTRYYHRAAAPGFAPTIFRTVHNPSYAGHLQLLKEGWTCYLTVYRKLAQNPEEAAPSD